MMSSREVVRRAVRFEGPERLPRSLPETYGSDFSWVGMSPSPDWRPGSGVDEWGAIWENIGISNMGQVKEFPIKTWRDFDRLEVPDIKEPRRWETLRGARVRAGDKFLLGGGISLYERVHFIRGLENTWADIYQAPERLNELVDILVDMNLYAIEKYAEEDVDGLFWCDDWGLQNRLMISADSWREIWKPRYARVYQAAHDAGLLTFLHSCGHIVEILDDLTEAGLDVIQLDQQENMGLEVLGERCTGHPNTSSPLFHMGLEVLGERFAKRITFWCPVDIQNTMARGHPEEIRRYVRKMVTTLAKPEGGFICGYYGDPVGAGHTQEAIEAMCQAFLDVSDEMYATRR